MFRSCLVLKGLAVLPVLLSMWGPNSPKRARAQSSSSYDDDFNTYGNSSIKHQAHRDDALAPFLPLSPLRHSVEQSSSNDVIRGYRDLGGGTPGGALGGWNWSRGVLRKLDTSGKGADDGVDDHEVSGDDGQSGDGGHEGHGAGERTFISRSRSRGSARELPLSTASLAQPTSYVNPEDSLVQ